MRDPVTTIRRRTKAERSTGFERLRTEGLALVQRTSGEIWTDHNLHDPGITMLEALCFALTEPAFRAEFPVEDLLTGPDGKIDFSGLALHPPHDALVCGATTPDDHRRRLLDRVAGLDDAALVLLPNDQNHIPGVMRLRLKLAGSIDSTESNQVKHDAVAVYRAERGLGEDIEPVAVQLKPQACWLQGQIEIGGAHDGVELLAEVYHRAAIYIDGGTRLLNRRALRKQGLSLDQIYDGPAVERGFLPSGAAAALPQERLYVSDLLRFLRHTVPGIEAIDRLQLLTGLPEDQERVLKWRSDVQALCLRLPGASEQAVQLLRRGQPVAINAEELRLRVKTLQSADRARRQRDRATLLAEQSADLPQGDYRPAGPYRSVQHEFPPVYGLGVNGIPDSAGAQRQARVRQLQAYLMLFDQVIANSRAQTSHLHELFSVDGGHHKTYWWELLDEMRVPGATDLTGIDFTRDVQNRLEFEREVLEPLDQGTERRHHLLDHLLALHGERLMQNAMRQYATHLTAGELDQLLLDNKTAYLRDIVPLLRYRARGYDYGCPLWKHRHRDNFSGLARRACLLLGLRHDRARSLTTLLKRQGLLLSYGSVATLKRLESKDVQAAEPALLQIPSSDLPRRRELLTRLGLWRGATLPAPLLRAGAAHDGYCLLSRPGGPAGTTLVLREAPNGPSWWALHTFEGRTHRADAIAAASALRDSLCQLNDACEGLHLVEHVLLRPLAPKQDSQVAARLEGLRQAGFFDLRLTAVFPDWTVRTAQKGFRRLAKETLHINCPAHLDLDIVWMGPGQMRGFEADYKAWMVARQELCHAQYPDPSEVLASLYSKVDAAALKVCSWLERKTP